MGVRLAEPPGPTIENDIDSNQSDNSYAQELRRAMAL
jgi:hypothetical protein